MIELWNLFLYFVYFFRRFVFFSFKIGITCESKSNAIRIVKVKKMCTKTQIDLFIYLNDTWCFHFDTSCIHVHWMCLSLICHFCKFKHPPQAHSIENYKMWRHWIDGASDEIGICTMLLIIIIHSLRSNVSNQFDQCYKKLHQKLFDERLDKNKTRNGENVYEMIHLTSISHFQCKSLWTHFNFLLIVFVYVRRSLSDLILDTIANRTELT